MRTAVKKFRGHDSFLAHSIAAILIFYHIHFIVLAGMLKLTPPNGLFFLDSKYALAKKKRDR